MPMAIDGRPSSGVVNLLNVLTVQHDRPHLGLLEPVDLGRLKLAVALLAFFWIAWVVLGCWRLSGTAALALAAAHPRCPGLRRAMSGALLSLRKLALLGVGQPLSSWAFWPNFLYELPQGCARPTAYSLAGIALVEHLLRQQQLIQTPGQTLTFDIRDGAKLTRVRLSDILAIASAGNYVEFALQDGRRLLMRTPLSALESELAGRGFVRTHRSWLVNRRAVTALKPEGSGDYEISLGSLEVPLSRRFKAALAKLRDG